MSKIEDFDYYCSVCGRGLWNSMYSMQDKKGRDVTAYFSEDSETVYCKDCYRHHHKNKNSYYDDDDDDDKSLKELIDGALGAIL